MRIGHEREPGETNKLQDSEKSVSPKRPERYSVSAKPQPERKQEGNPTKGLTYEELGRNNGKMIAVVEELEVVRRMCS